MIVLQILFWAAVLLIIHSYILFPFILSIRAGKKKMVRPGYSKNELPQVSVLISVYNEEKVILEKIRTVIDSDYPAEKIEILVGSDASSDGTDCILQALEKENKSFRGFYFDTRMGKPNIINHLATCAGGEILIITDANVMLENVTLSELIKYFKDPGVGLVDTRMMNPKIKKEGISKQEKYYIEREVRIKHYESILWGCMMGPFGGCFAVRKSCYKPVPGNYLVDDFFINMAVLDQGLACISNLDARVFEDVSNDISEEFRRKTRISAGNFQNLRSFSHLLIPKGNGVAFCFFSHKFLRWIVPFLVLITFISSVILGLEIKLYRIIALMHGIVLILPVIDHFLRKIKIHIIPLRFISHFIAMNLALVSGFFRFAGGVKSNVWKPTERYQK